MHPLDFLFDTDETVISKFFKDKLVTSTHHQAVKRYGNILRPVCVHKSIIEGCENDHVITIQFHPEFNLVPGNHCYRFFDYLKNEW